MLEMIQRFLLCFFVVAGAVVVIALCFLFCYYRFGCC